MINIVIPSFNEEHYIGQLLESLTRQTYKKFDVTVVDGNSQDKTRDVTNSYKKQIPGLTVLTTNVRNVSHQRNLGAKNGSAETILFLDADVVLHPRFLSQLLHETKKTDIANCWLIPLSTRPVDKLMYNLYNIIFLEVGKYIWPVAVGNNIFCSRKIFNKVDGFDEKIKTWEDVDFVKRAIEKGADFSVLRRPKIYASVRRFEIQGRMNYLIENMKGLQYAIRTGKMPEHIQYPMGLDYAKLKLTKYNSPALQKRLKVYYRNYSTRIRQVIREKISLEALDRQSQETIRDAIHLIRRLLSQ